MNNFYGRNPIQMLQAFNQFKQTFRGDPQQVVNNMLQNGQMSRQQYEQLKSMANQFRSLIM